MQEGGERLDPSVEYMSGSTAWREEPDGSRIKVDYDIEWGWLSTTDLFNLRQKYPRSAP